MITAGVLAKQSDVPLFTVRHYTRIGLLKPSRNLRNGYKIYLPSGTTRLRFIVAAKALGFTLHEIADILNEAKHGNSPCPMVREITTRRIEENRRKIKDLKKLQKKNGKCFERLGANGKFDAEWRFGLPFDRIGGGNGKFRLT